MKKYNYVYISILTNHQMYVGKRTTKINPLMDNYFGSPRRKCINWQPTNKLFIKFTTSPVINCFNECALHSWLEVAKNPRFYNKAKQTSVGFNTAGVKLIKKKRGPHSAETKAKMSLAQKGTKRNPRSAEHKAKIGAAKTKTAKVYTWSHPKIGKFKGTIRELVELHSVTKTGLIEVTRGKRDSHTGWMLCT